MTEETYREQREQHPGGNHDLTVPQVQPDLQNQLLLKLRPGFPFLGRTRTVRTQPSARSQRFKVQRDRAGTLCAARTWWARPQEAHRLQREPARLLRFKGTLWNRVRAFKGK